MHEARTTSTFERLRVSFMCILLASCTVKSGFDGGDARPANGDADAESPDTTEVLDTFDASFHGEEADAHGEEADAHREEIDYGETTDAFSGGEDVDPYCHYDCFGYLTCAEGIVTLYNHVAVPCEYWTGGCPHEVVYTCEKFCSSSVEQDPYTEPSRLCEEGRPKKVGDPCEAEADCEPQIPERNPDGSIMNIYLQCDLEMHLCVERPAPVVADWLATCDLSHPFGSEDRFEFGYVRSAACDSGLCIMAEEETCVRQGCTTECDRDSDCPMGAVCQFALQDWSTSHSDEVEVIEGVCKPGPYNQIGVGLECPLDNAE